jgi:hypothetical protein
MGNHNDRDIVEEGLGEIAISLGQKLRPQVAATS